MERDREEEERKMRKWGGWEVERKGARRKKESEGEREGGEREDRGQDRHVRGQLGARRPGGESMGRRRPLRGRAVHWADFPLKAGTLRFTREDKATANPTDSERERAST